MSDVNKTTMHNAIENPIDQYTKPQQKIQNRCMKDIWLYFILLSLSFQRYFVNDTFYQPGGPIFIMIGGEGTANPIWNVEGQWVTRYASMYKATCVQLEHRYYGESHPTE